MKMILIVCAAFSGAIVQGCANPDDALGTTSSALSLASRDDRDDEGGLPPEVREALRDGDHLSAEALDRIYRVEHDVTVAPGRVIHTFETFTLRAWMRWPHRAMLMLPGPVTNAQYFNIDVPGYDGGAILAQRGFFTFAADFEGAGRSSMPANGRDATFARDVEDMTAVLRYVRTLRLAPRVDVLGESWGGGVAADLCANASLTRSCVMASMIYNNASDVGNATFRSPEFRALLDSLPNGYLPTWPDFYMQFVYASPAAVQTFTFATQPGMYSVAPEYAVFELPFFDPTNARVPGLILRGELDPNQPLSDTQELARDYGRRGAELVVIAGGGHVPRVNAPPANTQFWDSVVGFVDPADHHHEH